MKRITKWLFLSVFGILAALILAFFLNPRLIPVHKFGFARSVSPEESALRQSLVDAALGWYGVREADGSHRPIIDRYNTLDPLPIDYRMTYDDAWCAAFGTVCAMEVGLTDIIPPECSCSRQIKLFQELGRWEEDDNYCPLPGDYIYYDWDFSPAPDCTGFPEHVGIVVGTYGSLILVMEGNKDDDASLRLVLRGDWRIRGYGLPDFASK